METLIRNLKTLGFTEYESRVFFAVLKGRLMSASEIADDAKIRRTDVYNILNSFVEKGYCNEIETNSVTKYEMIDPDVILDKIQGDIQKKRQKELSTLQDTFKELKPHYRTKDDLQNKIVNVELIRGFNQHRESKFIELLKKAKNEIHFMIRFEMYVSEEVDETAKLFFKNGGQIFSVYEVTTNFKIKKNDEWTKANTSDLIRICEKYEQWGETIKLSNLRVPNMTIFDRETVFININDKTIPKHNEADIIVRNKDFAENMLTVFDSFWNKSLSIEEYKKTL